MWEPVFKSLYFCKTKVRIFCLLVFSDFLVGEAEKRLLKMAMKDLERPATTWEWKWGQDVDKELPQMTCKPQRMGLQEGNRTRLDLIIPGNPTRGFQGRKGTHFIYINKTMYNYSKLWIHVFQLLSSKTVKNKTCHSAAMKKINAPS